MNGTALERFEVHLLKRPGYGKVNAKVATVSGGLPNSSSIGRLTP
ncbi:MAG: hypothetical protein ACREKE_01940 [bacterium]